MKYKLTVEATNDNKRGMAFIDLIFPNEAYFTTHTIVGNALRELVLLLLGEALRQIDLQGEKDNV